MPLKAIARHWPEENWALFEPILLARIGAGVGTVVRPRAITIRR